MNKNNQTYILIIIIIVAFIGVGGYFMMKSKISKDLPMKVEQTQTTPDPTQTVQVETSILYKNTKYGFNFTLPVSWKGYSVIEDKWTGQTIDSKKSVSSEGPKILIRNPLWTKEVLRQDIPIMIFTLSEWSLIQEEKLSVGAAPMSPSELGRNEEYVFALPARYNFAYPVGFEEVQKILESKPLRVF